MKAFSINCTLKRSPDFSNTRALAEKAAQLLRELDFESEIVRLKYEIKRF